MTVYRERLKAGDYAPPKPKAEPKAPAKAKATAKTKRKP